MSLLWIDWVTMTDRLLLDTSITSGSSSPAWRVTIDCTVACPEHVIRWMLSSVPPALPIGVYCLQVYCFHFQVTTCTRVLHSEPIRTVLQQHSVTSDCRLYQWRQSSKDDTLNPVAGIQYTTCYKRSVAGRLASRSQRSSVLVCLLELMANNLNRRRSTEEQVDHSWHRTTGIHGRVSCTTLHGARSYNENNN